MVALTCICARRLSSTPRAQNICCCWLEASKASWRQSRDNMSSAAFMALTAGILVAGWTHEMGLTRCPHSTFQNPHTAQSDFPAGFLLLLLLLLLQGLGKRTPLPRRPCLSLPLSLSRSPSLSLSPLLSSSSSGVEECKTPPTLRPSPNERAVQYSRVFPQRSWLS